MFTFLLFFSKKIKFEFFSVFDIFYIFIFLQFKNLFVFHIFEKL